MAAMNFGGFVDANTGALISAGDPSSVPSYIPGLDPAPAPGYAPQAPAAGYVPAPSGATPAGVVAPSPTPNAGYAPGYVPAQAPAYGTPPPAPQGYAPQAPAPGYAPQAPAPGYAPTGYAPVDPRAAELEWALYGYQGENQQLKARLQEYAGIDRALAANPQLQQKMFDLLRTGGVEGPPPPAAAPAAGSPPSAQGAPPPAAAPQGPRYNPEVAQLQHELSRVNERTAMLDRELQATRLAMMRPGFDRNAVEQFARANGVNNLEQAYYMLRGLQAETQAPPQAAYGPVPGYGPAPGYPPQAAAPGYPPQAAAPGYPPQAGYGPEYGQPQAGVWHGNPNSPPPQQVEVPRARAVTVAPQWQGPPASRDEGVERMVAELQAAGF